MKVVRARRNLGLALILGTLAAASTSVAAEAATFTVDNVTDPAGSCPTPTTCSLRQAVDAAGAASGDDVIDFNLPAGSVISLTSGVVTVSPSTPTDALLINGPGAGALTIRRDPSVLVSNPFNFDDGTTVLSGVTITNGTSGPFAGGAINNNAGLILDRVAVSGNGADAGGGGAGGAIVSFGSLLVTNSTISGNTVTNSGGGQSGSALVIGGPVGIVNSTITGNSVSGPGPGDGTILSVGADLTTLNTTIAGNTVQSGAGGVWAGTPMQLANTILAGNAGTAPDCDGELTSRGYNLLGNNTGCSFTAAAGDQVGTGAAPIDPLLGLPADNGGPTLTRALSTGSPAIDAGNPAAVSDADPSAPPALIPCVTRDQRGVARPLGPRCDIGAFEASGGTIPPPVFVAPDVDHFKCYTVSQKKFKRRNVKLSDQFTTKTITARLRSTKRLCNPVKKDGSTIKHPKAHLVCYAAKDKKKTFTGRKALVENQFGTTLVDVRQPNSLCVPSNKRKGTTKKPPSKPNPAKSLDNFRCYSVKSVKADKSVKLKDQFGTTTTSAVVKLVSLCNPVKRNSAKIRRPSAHLACYSIKDAKTFKKRNVRVRNPFGTKRLRVSKPYSLCLPSLKTTLPAAAKSKRVKRWGLG